MLHLSTDFKLQEWVTAILDLVPAKNLIMLERAEFGGNVESIELTYYSQKQVVRAGTVTEAVASGAATSIKIDKDLFGRITEGYLLMCGEEVIKVTAKESNPTANGYVLTVVRWYGDTPATAIAKDAEIKIMSKVDKEDGITEDYKAVDSDAFTNVIQDFSKAIYVTKRAAALKKKDMDDLLDLERLAKFDEMSQEIDKTLYYGRQNKNPGDWRTTMGWWKEAIANAGWVIFNANGTLSEDDFEACLLTIAQRYGTPEVIALNAWTKNKIANGWRNGVYDESRGAQKAGSKLIAYVSDSLNAEIPFEIDNQIENGHIFVGKARPLIHTMKDREFGNDIFFTFYRESSSSKLIYETLQSTITAEFQEANKEAFIYNVAAWSKKPTDVIIKNTVEEPVYTNEVATPTETETETATPTETATETETETETE